MRSLRCVLSAIVGVGLATAACATPVAWAGDPNAGYEPLWAEILERYTKSSESEAGTLVDYQALSREPMRARWQELLGRLAAAPPPAGRSEELALWINAYNILAIDTVVQSYPVDSIRDAGSFLWPVWKREAGLVAARRVSLDEIEHEILRPLGEPRIHAAIVCASTSCPSLAREPFHADDLERQLDEAMRRFLASPAKGLRIDRAAGRIYASSIFHWFEGDFEPIGGVRRTLRLFAPEADRAWLAEHADSAPLDYLDYDWTLNDWHDSASGSGP